MTNYISAKTARRRHEAALAAYNDARQKLEEAGRAVERAQLDVLRSRLAAPSEPKVGSDVRFEVTYRHHTKPYTYIALRTSDGWLVTGPRHAGKTYTWDEVLEIADRGISDPNLQVREAS